MSDYSGAWEGKIGNLKAFNFTVEIDDLHTEKPILKVSNDKNIFSQSFHPNKDGTIKITFNSNMYFIGELSKNGKEINGFIRTGLLLYHLKLLKSKANTFSGNWNILMVDELKSPDLYLSVENGSGDEYQAYPIFGDNRFTGTWCANFNKSNDIISFSDFKTGLNFKGKLFPQKIELGIYLGEALIVQTDLKRSDSNWKIGGITSNSKKSGTLQLPEMESLILKDSLVNTHAVLISKKGKTIYENYYNGYNAQIPHDTRSASKSVASAIVGIAKDKNLFNSVEQSIFEFLPEAYQVYKDSLKIKIDLKSLLTMSSGLDAIDFGINRRSLLLKTNFNPLKIGQRPFYMPMINEPNKEANYGWQPISFRSCNGCCSF
ncbi:MAG: hypothetical protein R2784_10800 [Saprospiraceae bacterium]